MTVADAVDRKIVASLMRNCSFAIPRAVADARPEIQLALIKHGLELSYGIARVKSYRLPCAVFTAPTFEQAGEALVLDVFRDLHGAANALVTPALVGRHKVVYLPLVPGKVRLTPPDDAPKDWSERSDVTSCLRHLHELAALAGGLELRCSPEDRRQRSPLPEQPGVINIFAWGTPPGESGHHYTFKAFDTVIDGEERKSILTLKPTPGRGEVLGDGAHDLVQLLGSNWYLMLPLVTFYSDATGPDIAGRLLALAHNRWAALKYGLQPFRPSRKATRKAFLTAAASWASVMEEQMVARIRELEERIDKVRLELAALRRDRDSFHRIRQQLVSQDHMRDLLAGFPEQWQRISRHPRIAQVELVGDGLQVTTTPVVIEHDNKRYPVGRFTIRVGKSGVLSIWALDQTHPDGIPHPHINEFGHPCFGNATNVIEDAAAEYRYASAIHQTITWLFDGYQHDLALHKIAEWPYEEVREDGSTALIVSLEAQASTMAAEVS